MPTIRSRANLGTAFVPAMSQEDADLADFLENRAMSADYDDKNPVTVPLREPKMTREYLGPRFQPPVKKGQGRTKRWAMR